MLFVDPGRSPLWRLLIFELRPALRKSVPPAAWLIHQGGDKERARNLADEPSVSGRETDGP